MKTLFIGPFVLVCVAAASLSAQTPSGPLPGALITVGDHKLHLRCVGTESAKPTVILEAGGGDYSKAWTVVQDLLANDVRSCAYDRAGLGWSEAGPPPRTMEQEVFELHELLQAAGVKGPLVLVGHSIGGLNVRLYATRYESSVAGMVLVDPTHESAVLYSVPRARWVRLRELSKGRDIPRPRLTGPPLLGYDTTQDYMGEEFDELYRLRLANAKPLGKRPLIVLGAGKRERPPGLADSAWLAMRQERDEQVRGLAELSSNSKFVLDSASTHGIPRENPRLIARAILEVVDAIVKHSAVSH